MASVASYQSAARDLKRVTGLDVHTLSLEVAERFDPKSISISDCQIAFRAALFLECNRNAVEKPLQLDVGPLDAIVKVFTQVVFFVAPTSANETKAEDPISICRHKIKSFWDEAKQRQEEFIASKISWRLFRRYVYKNKQKSDQPKSKWESDSSEDEYVEVSTMQIAAAFGVKFALLKQEFMDMFLEALEILEKEHRHPFFLRNFTRIEDLKALSRKELYLGSYEEIFDEVFEQCFKQFFLKSSNEKQIFLIIEAMINAIRSRKYDFIYLLTDFEMDFRILHVLDKTLSNESGYKENKYPDEIRLAYGNFLSHPQADLYVREGKIVCRELDVIQEMIRRKFFQQVQGFVSIDFSESGLRTLEFGDFGKLSKLCSLNLSKNNIESFDPQLLCQPVLWQINLSGNKLKVIGPEFFRNLCASEGKGALRVDISDNPLEHVDVGILPADLIVQLFISPNQESLFDFERLGQEFPKLSILSKKHNDQ